MKNLSIVIPVFNEEKRIHNAFEALSSLKLPVGLKLKEIIFVNDGSYDKTLAILTKFKLSNTKLPIKIISYKHNKGKGNAVRLGMLQSKGDYTLLSDADMSTPFTELSKFLPEINKGTEIIVGTRKNGKSTVTIHQTKVREMMGKSFTHITKFTLRLNISDFTCGFKLFSKSAVSEVFKVSKINGWGYDAEILFIAKQKKLSIVECPVVWADVKNSHVDIKKAVFATLLEIQKILLYHKITPYFKEFSKTKFSLPAYTTKLAQLFS